jgi:glycosyltransferase involved in cell wall biosynthesis
LIPTLNEEDAIEHLVAEAMAAGITKILVVDGYSTDGTRDLAERAGARVVLQDFGEGKGCGIRTGMRDFLKEDAELLGIIDGDETNVPSYLLSMAQATKSGDTDVVLGSRTRGPREKGAMNKIGRAHV